MSDWWAKKLGQQPQQPQRQPRTSTPPVPQQAPPQTAVPAQYAPQGAVQQPQQPPQVQGDPNAEVSMAEKLATTTYDRVPVKAQGQQRSGSCPGCGSGNYYTGTAQGGGAHCHDCGYPLVQAGSGMGALSAVRTQGPTQQAQSPQYSQQLGG